MKAYEEVGVQIHVFFTSALVGGDWSASHPGRFTSEKETLESLNRRLGVHHSWSGRYGEEKSLDRTGT
jgi:hypothetical protein